jgi:hypothetical protein
VQSRSGRPVSFCNEEPGEALSQLRISMVAGATRGDVASISTETNPWPRILVENFTN